MRGRWLACCAHLSNRIATSWLLSVCTSSPGIVAAARGAARRRAGAHGCRRLPCERMRRRRRSTCACWRMGAAAEQGRMHAWRRAASPAPHARFSWGARRGCARAPCSLACALSGAILCAHLPSGTPPPRGHDPPPWRPSAPAPTPPPLGAGFARARPARAVAAGGVELASDKSACRATLAARQTPRAGSSCGAAQRSAVCCLRRPPRAPMRVAWCQSPDVRGYCTRCDPDGESITGRAWRTSRGGVAAG